MQMVVKLKKKKSKHYGPLIFNKFQLPFGVFNYLANFNNLTTDKLSRPDQMNVNQVAFHFKKLVLKHI